MIFETLYDSSKRGELMLMRGGYCRYHLCGDGQLTVYEIISQRPGTGTRMLNRLRKIKGARYIQAKCPVDLDANKWYSDKGFRNHGVEETPSGRKVNVWRLFLIKEYSASPIITDANLVNFHRNIEELQLFWLYCGFSVMRTRARAQEALSAILDDADGLTPFARLRVLVQAGKLRKSLEKSRIGGYDRLEGFLHDSAFSLALLDPQNGKLEDFEKITGIGLAKARFFVLCTRANARVAVLDRHILQFLRDCGYQDVPKETPRNRAEYQRLEGYFLAEADKAGIAPAPFNLTQWRLRAQSDSSAPKDTTPGKEQS